MEREGGYENVDVGGKGQRSQERQNRKMGESAETGEIEIRVGKTRSWGRPNKSRDLGRGMRDGTNPLREWGNWKEDLVTEGSGKSKCV